MNCYINLRDLRPLCGKGRFFWSAGNFVRHHPRSLAYWKLCRPLSTCMAETSRAGLGTMEGLQGEDAAEDSDKIVRHCSITESERRPSTFWHRLAMTMSPASREVAAKRLLQLRDRKSTPGGALFLCQRVPLRSSTCGDPVGG